jgi:hypothetical protein
MQFHRTTLSASQLRSLAWDGDALVDWVGGGKYFLDGVSEKLNVGSSYRFDAAVGLGPLGVSFEALGTKGVLLRDNGRRSSGNIVPLSVDIITEINRSCYLAQAYGYPVTLLRIPGGQPVLAHCPRGYNILDLEDLD